MLKQRMGIYEGKEKQPLIFHNTENNFFLFLFFYGYIHLYIYFEGGNKMENYLNSLIIFLFFYYSEIKKKFDFFHKYFLLLRRMNKIGLFHPLMRFIKTKHT